eukprot:scaffold2338_cov184-Ochromonas_danica.AAC.6
MTLSKRKREKRVNFTRAGVSAWSAFPAELEFPRKTCCVTSIFNRFIRNPGTVHALDTPRNMEEYPHHEKSRNDKISYVNTIYQKEEEEEEAFSLSSDKGIASVKKELSSLSHEEALELLILLGCCSDLKELYKQKMESFESAEEVNGGYLNGVTKVEHLREIGDIKSTEPKLNDVLDDLQRIQKEGVPLELMQGIRRNMLMPRVQSSLQNMAKSGEVSALQELEALGSIAMIPAEDINRGFTGDLGDKDWNKRLEGVTALHVSASKGDVEMFGYTPLTVACLIGHVEVVRILLSDSRVDINKAALELGYTPLHYACSNGHVEVVKILMADSRVDVNKADNVRKGGVIPLHTACNNDHVELVKVFLFDARTNVNKPSKIGWTPLYYACDNGHVQVIVILLLDPWVDVNKANNIGWTPLHIACCNNDIEVAMVLLRDLRVDVNKTTEYGQTALDVAGTEDIKALLRAKGAIRGRRG